jgi:hypothetical protein
MESGPSRIEKWWEAEADRKLATTQSTSNVEVICSLIPGKDNTAVIGFLKERLDLDALFDKNLPSEERN